MPESISIHNLCFVGKDGVGKSLLIDRLLHLQDQRPNSLLAKEPEEEQRGYTIYNRFYRIEAEGLRLHLIDTPGGGNFLPKVQAAMRVSTGAVLVVGGQGSAKASLRLFEAIQTQAKPRVIFLNMLDHPETKWENALHEIEEELGLAPLLLQLPHYEKGEVQGLVDLLAGTYQDASGKAGEIPQALADEAKMYQELAWERLADLDDDLMTAILEGERPDPVLVEATLGQGIRSNKITPLLMGSAQLDLGVATLWDFLAAHLPPHHQGQPWLGSASRQEEAELIERRPLAQEPFSGICFKTQNDRFLGRLSYVLVVSGRLTKGMKLVTDRGESFEPHRFSSIHGKETTELTEALPGDIVVIEKEEALGQNQSLSEASAPIFYPPLSYPVPRCTYHLEMTGTQQDTKTIEALHRVMEDDPSLRLHKNEETEEMLLSGMGETHLEVVKEQLERLYKVKLELTQPFIAYHEALTKKVSAQGKHKKQTGGHGQFGMVVIELEPLPRGAGFEFVDKITGGVIPKVYIPAVEKGVIEALKRGALGGFAVVDVRVTLLDGSFHSVDSSEYSFQQAGILAVREALPKAGCILLEPIMEMEIDVPEESVGAVTKDVNSRRGRVLDYQYKPLSTVIKAQAPLAELGDYTPGLRGLTQGRGIFSMHLQGYEAVTSHLAQKILQERKA